MVSCVTEENNGTILVVDDNPLIVNVLTTLLTTSNYTVYTAGNGKEGITALKNNPVDVIVCDVMMPEMDGYEFHTYVRQQTEYSHIPFVFLTALGSNDELNLGRESGADEYLVKPFNPQDLISILKGKVIRSRNLKASSETKNEVFRKRVIHTLSHEFRTPLMAINTGTDLLLRQKKDLNNIGERAEKLLSAIQSGGQRLEKLVTDFMLFQQIEAGVAERLFMTHAALYTTQELMQEIVACQSEAMKENGFTFKQEVHNPDAEIKVYESQFLDITARIIENSIKFSSECPKEIELISYTRDTNAVFEIKDRGIGIDLKNIEEALNAFGQQDRDTFEQQGGGLGLAIVNKYMQINRGTLEFRNRQNGGSIVSLVFPLAR